MFIGQIYGVYHHFQQYISYIVDGQFYWWRKPEYPEKTTNQPVTSHWQTLLHIATEYPEKTTNLLQVIDKLYHILPRSTQRKPPTCHKSLTNFITYCHGLPRENHQPVTSHWQTLSHIATEYPEKTNILYPEKTTTCQVIDKLYHILPRSTQRKPPTCHKSLTNLITYCHGVPRENHQPVTSHWQTLLHIATEYLEKTTNLLQVIDKLYHILPRITQRKPPTCYKSLTNFITYCHGVPRENHQPVTSH